MSVGWYTLSANPEKLLFTTMHLKFIYRRNVFIFPKRKASIFGSSFSHTEFVSENFTKSLFLLFHVGAFLHPLGTVIWFRLSIPLILPLWTFPHNTFHFLYFLLTRSTTLYQETTVPHKSKTYVGELWPASQSFQSLLLVILKAVILNPSSPTVYI